MSTVPQRIFVALVLVSLVALCVFNASTVQNKPASAAAATNKKCTIPKLDPFDESIVAYLQKAEPLVCPAIQEEYAIQDEHGQILRTGPNANVQCRVRCFDRASDNDFELQYDDWIQFNASIMLNCSFREVECSRSTFPFNSVYSNNYAFLMPKLTTKKSSRRKTQYSVYIFVIDSLSHSNAIRNLPKTMRVLRQTYNSYILSGLTKVGDNSFPNAAAFMTGKRVRINGYSSELPEDMTGKTYDEWPLIWRNYSEKGYDTFYAEDYVNFNLFAYLAKGFVRQPVDYYFRPFWLNVYNSYLHRRSRQLCYGSRRMHEMQLAFFAQFVRLQREGARQFALHWLTELGHDFMHIVNIADGDFARFFAAHHDAFADSFLFVMGDHGHRFDAIRKTQIGRLEERLPLVSLHIPDALAKQRPEIARALAVNQNRLSSFFDIHATLVDVLVNNEIDWREQLSPQPTTRAMSVLRELPKLRSCQQAGIPEEFCVCEKETPISTNKYEAKRAAQVLISHINRLISPYPQCRKFELREIHHAQQLQELSAADSGRSWLPGGRLSHPEAAIRLRVSISAAPSAAAFEALIRLRRRRPSSLQATAADDDDDDEDEASVIGDVNRINKYGAAGDCIDAVNLRKFCACAAQSYVNQTHK